MNQERAPRLHRLRVRWAAIGAAVAVSVGSLGIGVQQFASAEVSRGDRPVFIPISCRLLDTRPNTQVGAQSGPINADATITLTAHGENGQCTEESEIPTDATGLALNVTAVGASELTFLTFWDDGPNPGTSSLNPAPGQPPTPNAVNTSLSPTGTFNVFNARGQVHTIIDVTGYYAPHNHDDRYVQKLSELEVLGGTFFPSDVSGEVENVGPVLAFDTTANRCATAPVPFDRDGPLESVSVRFGASNAFDVEAGVAGVRRDTTNAFEAVLGNDVARLEITTVPLAGAFAEIRDLEIPIVAPSIDTTTFSYYVQICAVGNVTVFGVDIDFAS